MIADSSTGPRALPLSYQRLVSARPDLNRQPRDNTVKRRCIAIPIALINKKNVGYRNRTIYLPTANRA